MLTSHVIINSAHVFLRISRVGVNLWKIAPPLFMTGTIKYPPLYSSVDIAAE
jgi:hypothetical protein